MKAVSKGAFGRHLVRVNAGILRKHQKAFEAFAAPRPPEQFEFPYAIPVQGELDLWGALGNSGDVITEGSGKG